MKEVLTIDAKDQRVGLFVEPPNAKLKISATGATAMNERIKELVEQCYEKHELLGTYEFNKEKFAELIVRECAQFIFVLDAKPMSHKSAARLLQEHFGVE